MSPMKAMKTALCLAVTLTAPAWIACGMKAGGQSGTDEQEIGKTTPHAPASGDTVQASIEGPGPDAASQGLDTSPLPVDPGPDDNAPPTSAPADNTASDAAVTPATDAGPAPSCVGQSAAELPGISATAVSAVDDSHSTACLLESEPGSLCFRGTIAEAGQNYAYWGAGTAVGWAEYADGGIAIPFDAESHGIAGLQFTLTGSNGRLLRAYVNQVDDPAIENRDYNYSENSFVGAEITEDGLYTLQWSEFRTPSWTQLDVNGDGTFDADVAVDATRLNSLQFFFAAEQGASYDYSVCIKNLQWIKNLD